MRNIVYTTAAILTIFLSGCNEDSDSTNEQVLLFWNQTKCADPWNTGENNTNSETEAALTTYLENENIVVRAVDFDNDSPLDTGCESCGCGTGQRIIVQVTNPFITEMENLGFYQSK